MTDDSVKLIYFIAFLYHTTAPLSISITELHNTIFRAVSKEP
jgi:hypothetical protein